MSVRNALLGLLVQKPRHGYELLTAFSAVTGGEQNWNIKPAQVYTTLARLEEAGLIAPQDGAEGQTDRRVFTITPAGHDELCAWFLTPVRSERQRDEFFLKLMLALATGEADPRKVMQVQRASLYRELHDLTAQRTGLDPRQALAQILMQDQAIMHVEADLRWLEMVEARLEEISRQPLPKPEIRPRGRPSKK